MNDQKKDQKQAGKAHEKFFTDRRSKKEFPGHMAVCCEKYRRITKIRCDRLKKEFW
jgi:uncharacterized protein YhfF